MTGALAPALQTFIIDSYGQDTWRRILRSSDVPVDTFEVMLSYDAPVAQTVLAATAAQLDRTQAEVLEDLGIYLVAHEHTTPIRRLLRFGGADFERFLETLGELPDRARLALSHVILPNLSVEERHPGGWTVWCNREPEGLVYLLLGAIRAMADEYGALVLAELADDDTDARHRIDIAILSHRHAEGRTWTIGQRNTVA